MKQDIHEETTKFFREFALRILKDANVSPDNPREFKIAMLDHYEEIYPHFAKTTVFEENFEKEHHEEMVEEYKRCFSHLLVGKLP